MTGRPYNKDRMVCARCRKEHGLAPRDEEPTAPDVSLVSTTVGKLTSTKPTIGELVHHAQCGGCLDCRPVVAYFVY